MRNYIVILLFFGWCHLSFSQSPYIFKRLTMADGMVSNYIVDIIQDKQGYIWMASESGLCKSLFKFCLVTFLSPPVSPFPQLNRT